MGRSAGRGAALSALVSMEEGERLDRALSECDRRAGSDDREIRLARRLVRGVTQSRGKLDWILSRVLRKGRPDRLDGWTRNVLRLGLYQILYLSNIPPHAAVNETVRLARSRGGEKGAGLVNGVLRTVVRDGIPGGIPSIEDDPVGHLVVEESYPPWLVARWVKRLGVERTAARLRAGNRVAPLSLRVLDSTDVDRCVELLRKDGVEPVKSRHHPAVLLLDGGGNPVRFAPFREGRLIVQDEGAAVVGLLAEPLDQVRSVLDICCAPGGKLISLVRRADPFPFSVAADISPGRLKRVVENVERTGPLPIRILAADGLALPFRNRFDVVLVDAPCSGLGTMARRADLRWRVTEADITRLAGLSCRLLLAAASRVEPGGVLLYSTCTTEAEENEDVVSRFLEKDGRFRLEPPAVSISGELAAADGTIRIVPEFHGCDGSFGARLRRIDR